MTINIVMRTQKFDDRVRYEVERNGKVIWHTEVRFGHTKKFRAGGAAFFAAASEQEVVAYGASQKAHMQMHSESDGSTVVEKPKKGPRPKRRGKPAPEPTNAPAAPPAARKGKSTTPREIILPSDLTDDEWRDNLEDADGDGD